MLVDYSALFQKALEIYCNKQIVLVLPLKENGKNATIGRVFKDKANCIRNKKKVITKDFLASTFRSFDFAYLTIDAHKNTGYNLQAPKNLIGKKVISLKSSGPEVLKTKVDENIKSCEQVKKSRSQVLKLPLEERSTHPDQEYGLMLWSKYCELKDGNIKSKNIGKWKSFGITEGTVLWSDKKNVITSLPRGVPGAPVFLESGELVGMQTGFNPLEAESSAISVAVAIHAETEKIYKNAKQLGLWDY